MLHPLGGRHARTDKTVATRFAWLLGLVWFPVDFGLQTGHPARVLGFGSPFQPCDPFLQALDDGLLADDDANQHIAVSGGKVISRIHTRYMT